MSRPVNHDPKSSEAKCVGRAHVGSARRTFYISEQSAKTFYISEQSAKTPDDRIGTRRIGPCRMDVTPRTPSYQNRSHAGFQGREHVVIYSISDVDDVAGIHSRFPDQPTKEAVGWLLGPPLFTTPDLVHRQSEAVERQRRPLRLISCDENSMASTSESFEGWQCIGIEILGQNPVFGPIAPREVGFEPIEINIEMGEDIFVVTTLGNIGPENTYERERRHSDMLGIAQPQAAFIDEGLPNVECVHDHRPNLAKLLRRSRSISDCVL